MTNDYYGQALAVDWDLNNTLGFTSNFTTPANTYDTVACSTAQDWRRYLPVSTRTSTRFRTWLFRGTSNSHCRNLLTLESASRPAWIQTWSRRLNSTWNLTFERQVSSGTKLTVSYIGRKAQNLLARRDVTAFNNVVDPKSGMDWYSAGTALEKQRQKGVATANVATIPFFENLFPAGLASIMNSIFGLDPVCGGGNPGFVPTWTNTQVSTR